MELWAAGFTSLGGFEGLVHPLRGQPHVCRAEERAWGAWCSGSHRIIMRDIRVTFVCPMPSALMLVGLAPVLLHSRAQQQGSRSTARTARRTELLLHSWHLLQARPNISQQRPEGHVSFACQDPRNI